MTKKILLTVLIALSVCFSFGFAYMKGDCTQDKIQLKDGSCQTAGDFLRIKLQLKDGSCQA